MVPNIRPDANSDSIRNDNFGRKTSNEGVLARLGSVLESPRIYLAYQWLVGGLRARHKCIREYIPPEPGLTVLDIGCGPGYVIADFRKPIYHGFDISAQYINWAKEKYPDGHFYCQEFDQSALERLPKADVVLMMGLIHHLDDAASLALLQLAKSAMKASGSLYTMDGCYRVGQSRIGKFFLDEDRGQYVRNEAGYVDLARRVFSRVEVSYRDDLFLIPYPSIVLQCRE